MALVGYVESKKAYIKKHVWNDHLGNRGISYLLQLNHKEYDDFVEAGLNARCFEHENGSKEYFIHITPISKNTPCCTVPDEEDFVERHDIDCVFNVYECQFNGKVFRKLYLDKEGIKKHAKDSVIKTIR